MLFSFKIMKRRKIDRPHSTSQKVSDVFDDSLSSSFEYYRAGKYKECDIVGEDNPKALQYGNATEVAH